jgi:hypothetical protein
MKIRRTVVGQAGQSTIVTVNGAVTSKIDSGKVNVFNMERLVTSSGHPFQKLGSPRRKPRVPKPYKGKDPLKKAVSTAAYFRYLKKAAKFAADSQADLGGEFAVLKCEPVPALHKIVDLHPPGNTITFGRSEGTYIATPLSVTGNITIAPSSNSQLDSYGATLISRCLPTNPLSNIGQFLGELTDLPRLYNPFAWKAKARHFKRLASEGSNQYLNLAFGWAPFINDINSFFSVSARASKVLQQYDRDSGRHIRRTSKLPVISSSVTSLVGNSQSPFPTPSYIVSGGSLTKTVVSSQRLWFSGSFTYYLPPIDGSTLSHYNRYRAYAQKLFGVIPTPDLIWELTPWSWAIDWLTNTGSVIRNYDAFVNQGLVMHYGYLMEEKTQSTVWSLDGFKLFSNPLRHLSDLEIQVSKRRRRATPYGFGLNPASFTPFQKGIIAALGINRASKFL